MPACLLDPLTDRPSMGEWPTAPRAVSAWDPQSWQEVGGAFSQRLTAARLFGGSLTPRELTAQPEGCCPWSDVRALHAGAVCHSKGVHPFSNVTSSIFAFAPLRVRDGLLRPRRWVRVWLTDTDRPARFPSSFAIVIWGVLTQKKPFAGEWARPGGGASVLGSGGRCVLGARGPPRHGGGSGLPKRWARDPRPTARRRGPACRQSAPAAGFQWGVQGARPRVLAMSYTQREVHHFTCLKCATWGR